MILLIICVIGVGLSSSNRSIASEMKDIDPLVPEFTEDQNSQQTTIPLKTPEPNDNTNLVICSIIFGILCPISFCMASLVVLLANRGPKIQEEGLLESETSNAKIFDSIDLTFSSYVTTNIVLIICSIIHFQVGSHAFDATEYFQIAAGGFICAVGIVVLNNALILGYIGPVFAVASLQVVFLIILDAVLLGQSINVIQVIASLFGVAGAITMAIF